MCFVGYKEKNTLSGDASCKLLIEQHKNYSGGISIYQSYCETSVLEESAGRKVKMFLIDYEKTQLLFFSLL